MAADRVMYILRLSCILFTSITLLWFCFPLFPLSMTGHGMDKLIASGSNLIGYPNELRRALVL